MLVVPVHLHVDSPTVLVPPGARRGSGLKLLLSEKTCFLIFSKVLEDLERFGRILGFIFTKLCPILTEWGRVMAKKLKTLTTKKVTTTLM